MTDLFLIDGNSLVYRAFFALPDTIATSKGEPTNAIFGFASMLVKLLTEHGRKPTVVVWDAGLSGRKEVYAEYKANREKRPDLLGEQWPAFEPLVEAFGFHNVSVKGYEADDVIGSLAERAKQRGEVDVTVVTGDRDSFQLVDDHVKIMATARGITETKLYDREAVIERYGIPPELVPDFIGLKGDTSDNIPGVPGIGDKTAAQLLQEFGSLEEVLGHVDQVSGTKRRQNLIDYADDARISKQLGTIDRTIDVELNGLTDPRDPDIDELRELLRRYEIRDPLRRLEDSLDLENDDSPVAPEAPAAEAADVKTVTLDELGELPESSLTLVFVAPEVPEGALFTDGNSWQFAISTGTNVLVGECETPSTVVEALGDRPVTAHDAKRFGVVPAQLEHDTFVAAFLLDPARRDFSLAELAADQGLGEGGGDAAAEVLLVRQLAELQDPGLERDGLTALFEEIELPLVRVLRAMEVAGVALDRERLAGILKSVESDVLKLEGEIHELAGERFTIGSPQQLSEILFVKLGLSRKRRGKTGYSTDARVLQAIRDEHPIIPKIEQYRALTKLVSTYLSALPQLVGSDGRLHTTFNQAGAATGRISSTNPNMQNIPVRTELGREVRACFVAEPGNVLISADYTQVELRILAELAGEEVLQDIFRRGEDVHTATAAEVFGVSPDQLDPGMRSKAKMVNYGIVYGLSAFGLADRLSIPQLEAKEFIDRYFERFPAVQVFIEQTVKRATNDGYAQTAFGRRRPIPELRSGNHQTHQLGERLAVNTVIQGTAADVIKIAMVRCYEKLTSSDLETRLILQIHDELLFEGPKDEAERASEIIREQMAAAYEIEPPLTVDLGVGANWLEAK